MSRARFIAVFALSTLGLLGCGKEPGRQAASEPAGSAPAAAQAAQKELALLNASYDQKREL